LSHLARSTPRIASFVVTYAGANSPYQGQYTREQCPWRKSLQRNDSSLVWLCHVCDVGGTRDYVVVHVLLSFRCGVFRHVHCPLV